MKRRTHMDMIVIAFMPHAFIVAEEAMASGKLATATAAAKPTTDGYESGILLAKMPSIMASGMPSMHMPSQITMAACLPCACECTSSRRSWASAEATVTPESITCATAAASRQAGCAPRTVGSWKEGLEPDLLKREEEKESELRRRPEAKTESVVRRLRLVSRESSASALSWTWTVQPRAVRQAPTTGSMRCGASAESVVVVGEALMGVRITSSASALIRGVPAA
mmetsp:Transcript_1327/g.2852  ORF Transcript_1327/g.2852 Transcript_1327/m.2852 type:complete len:225 (-) Transcript_1327:1034-1708(-)